MSPSPAHVLKALRSKVLGGALPARGGMWMAVDLRDAKAECGFSDRQFAGHLEALAALDLFHASSQAVGLVRRLPSIQTETSTHDQTAPTPAIGGVCMNRARIIEWLSEFANNPPAEILPAHRLEEDLGLDSLDIIEFTMAVEDEVAMEFPWAEIEALKTVQEVIDYAGKQLGVTLL